MNRTKSTSSLASLSVMIVVPTILLLAAGAALTTGEPLVWKYALPDAVEAGDPVTVTIRIAGYSGTVATPVPFDGVLLIDQSGSMGSNDPNDKRIDAAESFVDCVANDTRLAVVAFASDVTVVQGLTSNKNALHNQLDDIRGDEGGGTDMLSGMEEAQSILINDGLAGREQFIIMLTDGDDPTDDAEYVDAAQRAFNNSIVYYSIALGADANFARLFMISTITEGTAYLSSSPADLEGLYVMICDRTGKEVRTRDIVLHERLKTSGPHPVSVVPGSFVTSVEGVTDAQKNQFYATGSIDIEIGALASEQEKTVSFEVFSDCLTPEAGPGASVDVDIDDESSYVSYVFGTSAGTKPVPQQQFTCIAPGDFWAGKKFYPETMTLEIEAENRWSEDPDGVQDNSLTDIFLIEQPSFYFQADLSTVDPQALVAIPSYQTDFIIWRIPRLLPKETRTFLVSLQSTGCTETYSPPIGVDAEKYTGRGYESRGYYRDPFGERKWEPIPQQSTTLISVEDCDGRPDLFVEHAYNLGEFKADAGLAPRLPHVARYVLNRHDSRSIWVDTEVGNGLWDGTTVTMATHIEGVSGQHNVTGQGDRFYTDSRNMVYVNVANSGTKDAASKVGGVRLDLLNQQTQLWEPISQFDRASVDSERGVLASELILPGTIRPKHIREYSWPLDDVLRLVRRNDVTLWYRVTSLLSSNPAIRSALEALDEVTPQLIIDHLPTDIACSPSDQMCIARRTVARAIATRMAEIQQDPDYSWGKTAVDLRVSVAPTSSELHTNNNTTTETVVVED